jgi:hypothetical protein
MRGNSNRPNHTSPPPVCQSSTTDTDVVFAVVFVLVVVFVVVFVLVGVSALLVSVLAVVFVVVLVLAAIFVFAPENHRRKRIPRSVDLSMTRRPTPPVHGASERGNITASGPRTALSNAMVYRTQYTICPILRFVRSSDSSDPSDTCLARLDGDEPREQPDEAIFSHTRPLPPGMPE